MGTCIGVLSGWAVAQSVLPPTSTERRDSFGPRNPGMAPILDIQIEGGISLPKGVEEQREMAAEPKAPALPQVPKPAPAPLKPEPKR